MTDPRAEALRLFKAGVAAADPYEAVARKLGNVDRGPALIVAMGKAAPRMARAALARFPGTQAIVVTHGGNDDTVAGAEVHIAAHPVPDARGEKAAQRVIELVEQAEDRVLALISGGGSALLPAPVPGISLADKAALNSALLLSGLDIRSMNLIRQQVSQLKGGGLLRIARHGVTALILSDVVGDDISAIASGPTAPPIGTKTEARAMLELAGVWAKLPESIKAHLSGPDDPVDLPLARNLLVGSNTQSLEAMAAQAPGAKIIETPVEGDVSEAARVICDAAETGITLWGGETTVRLRGSGKGGRNQELSLRIALEAKTRGWARWTCLQGGTDGRDGPTDAAGGLVDQETLARIAEAGGDLPALLDNNDSYAALALAGDLLMTGATGTNVADLGLLIRA